MRKQTTIGPDTRLRFPLTMAVAAGIVISMAAAGCSDGGSDSSTSTTGPPDTTTTTLVEAPLEAGTQLFVYNPSIGDCFERRLLSPEATGNKKQTEVTLLLPCDLPHRNEVFDVVTFQTPPDSSSGSAQSGSSTYPGEPTLRAFAKKNCFTNFMAFTGKEYEHSTLEVGFVIPTESNWVSSNPLIGCYVYDPANELVVGSFRDSRR